jgi:hypothetical protein
MFKKRKENKKKVGKLGRENWEKGAEREVAGRVKKGRTQEQKERMVE